MSTDSFGKFLEGMKYPICSCFNFIVQIANDQEKVRRSIDWN